MGTDDGSGGDGGDGSDKGGNPAETLCGELSADEYVACDAGETPLICDFDASLTLADDFGQHILGTHRAVVRVFDFLLRVNAEESRALGYQGFAAPARESRGWNP